MCLPKVQSVATGYARGWVLCNCKVRALRIAMYIQCPEFTTSTMDTTTSINPNVPQLITIVGVTYKTS